MYFKFNWIEILETAVSVGKSNISGKSFYHNIA